MVTRSRVGENAHGKQAAIQGLFGGVADVEFVHGSAGGRSHLLPAIRSGRPQSGARWTLKSGLRGRIAGHSLVFGLCGPLRMVPWHICCCHRGRKGRPDPLSERLFQSMRPVRIRRSSSILATEGEASAASFCTYGGPPSGWLFRLANARKLTKHEGLRVRLTASLAARFNPRILGLD